MRGASFYKRVLRLAALTLLISEMKSMPDYIHRLERSYTEMSMSETISLRGC